MINTHIYDFLHSTNAQNTEGGTFVQAGNFCCPIQITVLLS